jgi:phosphoglycerate dehydrogenase-like enzyme
LWKVGVIVLFILAWFAYHLPLLLYRGAAVDEAALFKELCKPGGICAALDVFAEEPLPAHSPLWTVPDGRVLMSSHNADLTDDYFILGWNIFQDNLACFLQGRDMATPVDRAAGY